MWIIELSLKKNTDTGDVFFNENFIVHDSKQNLDIYMNSSVEIEHNIDQLLVPIRRSKHF